MVATGASVAGAVALWPSSRPQAGYPFARRMAGTLASPLWKMDPRSLDRLMQDDASRLERAIARLDRALSDAEAQASVLSAEKVDDLSAQDREMIRTLWWSAFEPLVAIDDIKERYEHWYGIDYVKHPDLHASAYTLTFSGLCAQVRAGHRLVELVADRKLAQKLFDEAMPELGLPRGTFSALRDRFARSRDYAAIPVGAEWYDRWIASHLPDGSRPKLLVDAVRGPALGTVRLGTVPESLENKEEIVRGWAFRRWFPVQKGAATWFGDTRVAPQERRLVSDAQVEELGRHLRPGDILLERRNWYLSNIGLPGFWPHAALYVGTQDEVRKTFDGDEGVRAKFGSFSEHLARSRPAAWHALGQRDAEGHPNVVVEAVSEGVTATSLQHSCGADYVAALRPKLDTLTLAHAVDRALSYFGRPYDFDFDFATDDEVVCSELVVKAFESGDGGTPKLAVPFVTVAGRRAVPPTEIVRLFAAEMGKPEAQLEFVYFLDGREKSKDAVVADAQALIASASRPKWDVAQP